MDTQAVLDRLDAVLDGAPGRFVARARSTLEDIQGEAEPRWPRATGRTAGAFRLATRLSENAAEVRLENPTPYVFFTRWSVRLEQDLDNQAIEAGRRGKTAASQEAIRANTRRWLTRAHGRGAPTEQQAGKQPWVVLVRRPGTRALKTLLPELQDDLNTLAKEG